MQCWCIQDTGRGMAPDVVDKVFVPFYTTKLGGTGLGMVFVRQIVDEHRGTITLDSQPGPGHHRDHPPAAPLQRSGGGFGGGAGRGAGDGSASLRAGMRA